MVEGQITQDKVGRLLEIISDKKTSQGILIVGNKRGSLRSHDAILHSISEITQIGESQSFFLPDSFTGTIQESERVSVILEERLLKLIPIDITSLEIKEDISAPKPHKSSSLISRYSLRKRARQESQIINDESFEDSLMKGTKNASLAAGQTQKLFEAHCQIDNSVKTSSREQDQSQKREEIQGEELDLVSDDSDSPYMRQVKRLLTSDCVQGKEGGKLVAVQGLQGTEEIVNSLLSVLYHRTPSDVFDKNLQGPPKVVIIASQKKRVEQIQDTIENQFIKEAYDPPFKLVKSEVSKASKQKSLKKDQEKLESFREIFDVNQVFVLLDRKFFNYLIHGELDISKVDYLIFDEVHNIYPESFYVSIMNKFIFNHNLMLTPTAQLEDNIRLPKVLAFFNLDSVLQAAENNDSKIMKKLYFMANTFNSSLLCLKKQDLEEIERDIARKFSLIRVRHILDISHLAHQVRHSLEFSQKARKYLSLRRDGETRVTCLPEKIIEKKRLQSYLLLETKFAKISLDEAEQILQEFGAKLLENLQNQPKDQQKNLYIPNLETAQWVFNKFRYFSSRIQFDQPLQQLLGKDIVNNSATKIEISSKDYKSESQALWLYSSRIYLNRASKSQAALEMLKILYSQGHLDQNLRLSIQNQSQELYPIVNLSSPSIDNDRNISHKEAQDEEDKTSLTENSQTTKHSSTKSSRNQQNTINQSMDSQIYNSNIQITQNQKMLPRVCKIDHENNSIKEANEFFFQKFKNNNEKLDKELEKGQHHMPIMQFNTSQLELFIQTILNPILKALSKYNTLCYSQKNTDFIRFDDLNVNMISESSIKDLLFKNCFPEKQDVSQVNKTFIQFKNYRQRMFNIYDKNNKQRNDQEYPILVQMIDESLERYKFPHFMTKHIKNYHSQERGKPSQSSSKVREDFNRKTFLTMLMIALSDKEPTTLEFEKVKNEMGRLALVGDSFIILCQTMNMIFSGKKSFSEKDLDAVKNQTVKTEKLSQKAQKFFGLDYLRIKAKYYQKTPPNPQVEAQQIPRYLGDVMKSLAGLFSIYLGFGATYLLLSDLGIFEPPTSDQYIKIGKISVAQKVEILKTISQNRQDLLVYKKDKNMDLLKTLCNKKYPGQNKNHQAGSEIVDFWKILVKSRGLFMKHDLRQIFPSVENTDNKEDDSMIHLRDYSIANSYKSSSSGSLETQEGQSSLEKTSSIQTYQELTNTQIEEEKSQLAIDDDCIMYQLLKRFKAMQVEDATQTDNTGGEEIDEDIVEETAEPNQKQIEDFERAYKELIQEGYEFKNEEILLQCIMHKSASDKLKQAELKDVSQIDQDVLDQYNHQILKYLGDSILNFTLSKLFYCETAYNQKKWHGDFFVPSKIHELKTWFSSNNWLSFALYENYYCTITEEIPRNPQYQKTLFAEEAQESIKQLQNKKISEKEAIQIAPRVPLIYDKNDNFEKQINYFNGTCFRQCLAADKNESKKISYNLIEGLNVTSKSLSLMLFKNKDVQQQDQNEVDFSEIDEKFVKYYSDVMEALIGGIFMDSGDLDKTQMILLKLINCPSVSAFPIVQHDRTAVLSVFNSKPYCKGIKLYHTLEEKDGYTYIMGYMGKLQFRRLKYSKERKKKVQLFYYDMRLYLEDAYKDFEMNFLEKRNEDDKREPTIDEWLDFNKDYRKTWKVKVYSADKKRYSAIKEAAKMLYKFVQTAEENFKTQETQNIPEMRNQIIKYLNEGLQIVGANKKFSLQVLESERVQSSRIRELLQCSDIKFINCLSYDMKDVGNFIHKLNNRQVHQFYERLIDFGKA